MRADQASDSSSAIKLPPGSAGSSRPGCAVSESLRAWRVTRGRRRAYWSQQVAPLASRTPTRGCGRTPAPQPASNSDPRRRRPPERRASCSSPGRAKRTSSAEGAGPKGLVLRGAVPRAASLRIHRGSRRFVRRPRRPISAPVPRCNRRNGGRGRGLARRRAENLGERRRHLRARPGTGDPSFEGVQMTEHPREAALGTLRALCARFPGRASCA